MNAKNENVKELSKEFHRDMYKDGAKKYLLPGKVLLQGVCCWPDSEKAYMKVVGWFLFWNLFVIEIFHIAYVLKNFNNISDSVEAGATVTTTIEGLVRVYIMLMKKKVINGILVKVWKQFWPLDAIEPERREKIEKSINTSFLFICFFFLCAIISNSQIAGLPFVKNRGLILKSVFPFDWEKTYVYEVVYVWQYYSEWFILFIIYAFDIFFISLVTICATQFVIMQEIFKYILMKESRKHRSDIFGRKGVYMTDKEMLYECLEQHKLLIGICNELENSFNMAILIQFFVSTSTICAASIVLKVDYTQFFKMFLFAAGHLSQLFFYCFVGHELTYQSGHLSDAIYECNWHLFYDKSFRKVLVLMIQRSQRVQCLTAAGIMELDFTSFLKILRLSFSFYTLLNNLLMKNFNQ